MKILIVSDAAQPQVNGVVRTLENTIKTLKDLGHDVLMVTPNDFSTFTLPFYSEIKLAYRLGKMEEIIRDFDPECIHIATEGPLGWKARGICIRNNWAFTTAYHTDFPSYLEKHFRIPKRLSYSVLRKFHSRSSRVMVSTQSTRDELIVNGISNTVNWSRGVDNSFKPYSRKPRSGPILYYVGRVSREKNIEDFLNLNPKYRKVVVGDGPMLEQYRADYPEVQFVGKIIDSEQLARHYSDADVLVFPSRTDTFGLVMIEAIACQTPVAAYPVKGPIDILTLTTGAMNDDLEIAVEDALLLDRMKIKNLYTWEIATEQFVNNLKGL